MRNHGTSFLYVVVIVAAISAQAQEPTASPVPAQLPRAPGKVFTVTPEAGFHNEPSIAVNPGNPLQVVAAYQAHASVAFSQDGGDSWKAATGTASTDYKVSGDVSITYDKHGAAILCYIAFDKLGTENYWARGATRNGIFIRRSADGGATWEAQDHAVIAQPSKPDIPFEDKSVHCGRQHQQPVCGQPICRLDGISSRRQRDSFLAIDGWWPNLVCARSTSARITDCRATITARSKDSPER